MSLLIDDPAMKILAFPGLSNRESNPYNFLLYSHMEKQGVVVVDKLSFSSLFDSQIFHIHWPEIFLNHPRPLGAFLRGGKLLAILMFVKIFRLKLVWTVHNLKPHERRYPGASKLFYHIFPKLCDGFIFLSDYTREAARDLIPSIDQRKSTVILHGDYRPILRLSESREDCRRSLGVSQEERLVLFFGMIRRYKDVPKLIVSFSRLREEALRLIVAGRVVNDDTLGEEIETLASKDDRVTVFLKHIPEQDLIRFLLATDLVVLPYADVANSGSVIMALSVGCRVIAPRKGSLAQVQDLVGKDWLSLYDGDFSEEVLERALNHRPTTARPDLSQFEWCRLADQTLSFMRRL